MRRVLVTGSPASTDTAIIRDALATVWDSGTAGLVSGARPTRADRIAETIWTLIPDLHGWLCAGHPYPNSWDAGSGSSPAGRNRGSGYRRPVNMTRASESLVHGPARVVLPDARAGRLPDVCVG
jgi:hypothetical protein